MVDLPAVLGLAVVASITPGPNNLMLWGSGMNHGVRSTLPHLAGVSAGFSVLVFGVAVGLGSVFERYHAVEVALEVLGACYLAHLAHRIFTAPSVDAPATAAPPMSFTGAALFQWVNPKAWVMAVTASTLLGPGGPLVGSAMLLTATFWLVNLPCITAWMLAGAASTRWVTDPERTRTANRVLGALLGGTAVLLVV